jgi:hypothetical protein
LNVPVEDFYYESTTKATVSGVPVSLEHWILSRQRIFNPEDGREIDTRLFDGFIAELGDLLGRQDRWLELRRSRNSQPFIQMGAIWDLLILGVACGSFAIHCSWDS